MRSESRLLLHRIPDKRRESQNQGKAVFVCLLLMETKDLFASRRGGSNRGERRCE